MKCMNLVAVFDPDGRRVLMCKRRKNPYMGLYNLVGGKIEPGEASMDAAYRELFEETGLSREQISLIHYADYTYYTYDIRLEWYAGRLKEMAEVSGEENDLEWISLNEDFFDQSRFAGEGNIGHIFAEMVLENLIDRL